MSLTIWFLNVGYGDAIYAEAGRPGQEPFRMLMDGGSAHKAAPVREFLAERGVRTLDLLVATHLHEDHVAGLALVAQDLERVHEFWGICGLPPAAARLPVDPAWAYYTAKTGESLNAYLALIREHLPRLGARVLTAGGGGLAPGLVREFGPGIRLEVLFTGGARTAQTTAQLDRLYREPNRVRENLEAVDGMANEACLAIRLTAGGATALLPGDSLLGWWAGLDPGQLKADLLKLTHHGAADGTSPELLQMVRPAAAVVSVGLDRTDRPEPSVVDALGSTPLYRSESRPGSRFAIARWTEHFTVLAD